MSLDELLEPIKNTARNKIVTIAIVSLCLIVFIFIAWSTFFPVNEKAMTTGKIIPGERINVVQHLEGGIVSAIRVSAGEFIQRGTIIMELDPIKSTAQLSQMQVKRANLMLNVARLQSYLQGQSPQFDKIISGFAKSKREQLKMLRTQRKQDHDEKSILQQQLQQYQSNLVSIQQQIKHKKMQIHLLVQEVKMRDKLAKSGYDSKLLLIRAKYSAVKAKEELATLQGQSHATHKQIQEFHHRLSELNSRQREEALNELSKTIATLNEVNEAIKSLEDTVNRLVIKSPISGIVQTIPQNTIGSVIQPGGTIAEIVPISTPLFAEVELSPRDRGFVNINQSVQVKVEAFDFSRYGYIQGTVKSISANTFVKDNGQQYYQVKIQLLKNYVGNDPKRNHLLPGMTLQADIITGHKTLLQYILKPIYTNIHRAFSER